MLGKGTFVAETNSKVGQSKFVSSGVEDERGAEMSLDEMDKTFI